MKESKKIGTIVITLILVFTVSLNSCTNKTVSEYDTTTETYNESDNYSVDTICPIHEKNCERYATEMEMNLEEYHKWQDDVLEEINREDDDLASPNTSEVEPNSYEKQKQWVNCKYCHGTGLRECSRCNGTGTLHYHNSVDKECENCNGSGRNKNCSTCDGRGQVLMEY
jgi:hypothetical protein